MVDNRNTFGIVPTDLTNVNSLRIFLSRLVEQLDVAFGVRADSGFLSSIDSPIVQVVESSASYTTLSAQVTVNTGVIDTNRLNIFSNTISISANASGIATNSINISSLSSARTNNSAEIDKNSADIMSNNRAISANAVDITTNSSNISSLSPVVMNNSAEIEKNNADITSLDRNLRQASIADSVLPLVTPGAAYVQAEAQTVASQIQTLQTTVNDILIDLRLANVVS